MKKLNLNLAIAKTFCCDHNALYLLSLLVQGKEQTRPNVPFGTGGESTTDFPACCAFAEACATAIALAHAVSGARPAGRDAE
jgi:hypothetical protein